MTKKKRKQNKQRNDQGKSKYGLITIGLLTFVVAFCSIVYQLLLAHTMSQIAGNEIIWYSITIGVFLGSLGLGAILSERIKEESLLERLVWVELALAIFGGFSVILMRFVQLIDMYLIAHGNAKAAFVFILIGSQAIVVIIGLLSGFELPILIKLGNQLTFGKKVTNRILGIDYFGSLLGAIAFPLFFITNFSILKVGFLVAILNMIIVFLIIILFPLRKNKKRMLASLAGTVFLIVGFSQTAVIEKYFLQKYYFYPQATQDLKGIFTNFNQEEVPEIQSFQSPYQKIEFVDMLGFNPENVILDAYSDKMVDQPDFPLGKELYLNGDWQFNSSTEEVYHEFFAHMPILITGEVPREVLVLGGGDGLLTRELLKHEGIEKITQVELDAKMVELANESETLLAMNGGSLKDERVEVIIADAYNFVRKTDRRFDAVYIDFPTPVDYNTAKLYSQEFYQFVGNVLKEEGYLNLDAPGIAFFREGKIIDEKKTPIRIYLNTLKAAGFKTVLPYISNLEKTNLEAMNLAKEVELQRNGKGKEGEWSMLLSDIEKGAERALEEFIDNQQEGFIFVRKGGLVEVKYHQTSAKTYLMSERRFNLAFDFKCENKGAVDMKYVNSGMKPLLPQRKFWNIRFPYYMK